MRPGPLPNRLKAMFKEHRRDPRETLALPVVTAQGATGVTRDISASGLFFVMAQPPAVGGAIDFHIDLDTADGPLRLIAQGQVVRVEGEGSQTGVAVRLTQSRLEQTGR